MWTIGMLEIACTIIRCVSNNCMHHNCVSNNCMHDKCVSNYCMPDILDCYCVDNVRTCPYKQYTCICPQL